MNSGKVKNNLNRLVFVENQLLTVQKEIIEDKEQSKLPSQTPDLKKLMNNTNK